MLLPAIMPTTGPPARAHPLLARAESGPSPDHERTEKVPLPIKAARTVTTVVTVLALPCEA